MIESGEISEVLERKSWDQEDARKVRFKEWIQRVQVLIVLTVPFIGSGSFVSSWSLGIFSDAFDMSLTQANYSYSIPRTRKKQKGPIQNTH